MSGPISIIFGMYMGIDSKNKIPFFFFKNVGARLVIALWALEWAWHPAETNLRFAGSSRICKQSPKFLPILISEISAFIRTDGHG